MKCILTGLSITTTISLTNLGVPFGINGSIAERLKEAINSDTACAAALEKGNAVALELDAKALEGINKTYDENVTSDTLLDISLEMSRLKLKLLEADTAHLETVVNKIKALAISGGLR